MGYHSHGRLGLILERDMLLMGVLCHSPVPPTPQSNQEQNLQQKLLEDQFGVLQETVREAQEMLHDAMAKLDDPLHLRCTSSPGMSCSSRGWNMLCLLPPGQRMLHLSSPMRFFPPCLGRLGSDFPG